MKHKIAEFGPYILLGLIFIILIVLNLFSQDHWLDSDMAAEMIFSKLLAEEGHFFATPDWYYSTEFRFLYTHLVMGPLFRFLSDWHVIRMITNIVSYVLMVASYFYMMKPLRVDSRWTALTGTILLLPFSETMMLHMQMGNTYMVHVIIVLFFFGMFLRLVEKDYCKGARKWEIMVFYVILAVICGVSGVRYLLAMQCPLLLSAFVYLLQSEEFQLFRREFGVNKMARAYWKRIWKCERMPYLYYSLLGLAGSIIGYGINVLWVSRKYVFQTYEATNFIAVYQGILWERLQNAFGSLLMLFGYIPDRGVLSLRGIITLISFVLIAVFGYCTVKAYKKSEGQRFFAVLFFTVSFALNLFVFVFTTSTMVPRYYITILIFALPSVAFYLEKEEIVFDRFMVGAILTVCFACSTGKTILSFLTADKNEDKRAVAEFLQDNGYDFGFATYWNGNIITELTNGEVEIGNILDPGKLEYFTWSSPVKYYEEGYHAGETFLLLTADEMSEYADTRAVQTGELVYEDGKYAVLLFDSTEELMGCRE